MRYMVAVDGSDDALRACALLKRIGLEEGDEVDLVYVLEELWGIRKSFKEYENLRRVRNEFSARVLIEAEEAIRSEGITLRSVTLEGEPEEAIVHYAERMGVDMIAMGASGFLEAPAVRLGSVARRVATAAPLPVLVARKEVAGAPGAPFTIVFGTDGSECSSKALAALRNFPFPRASRLTVLHAVDSAMRIMPERFSLEIDDRVKETIASVRQHELAEAESLVKAEAEALGDTFAVVETRIPLGEPTTEILNEVERQNADLVVVGCRGVRGVEGMLGSVSRRILSKAPCSVLVSKMPG